MFVCLPQPRTIEMLSGALACRKLTLIYLPADAGELEVAAAKLLQEELQQTLGRVLPISRAWRPPVREVIALGSPQRT